MHLPILATPTLVLCSVEKHSELSQKPSKSCFQLDKTLFQLIQQNNVFEDREQRLRREVVYYAGLPGQFEDEEAMYEKDVPTDMEGPGNDQYRSKDSSDMFIGPAAEGDFMRLQRHFITITYITVTYRRGWRNQ